MNPWTANNNTTTNKEKMTSTVKEEVPRMTTTTPSPQRLGQALEGFVGNLEGLQDALLNFERLLEFVLEPEEGALKEGAPEHQNGHTLRLLSPVEVCQELGEESTVVYRRLRSGEIPSLKLGHTLKVRQADLEEYIKGQHHLLRWLGEENSFRKR
jgi:excisionase family DNA binding protein